MTEYMSEKLTNYKKKGNLIVELSKDERSIRFRDANGVLLCKVEDIEYGKELYDMWSTNN